MTQRRNFTSSMSDVAPNLGILPASVADMLTCNDNGTITTWIDKTFGRSIVDRPCFLPAGGRAIKGAPENTRNVVAAQRKYMKSILSTGINHDSRGTPAGYVDDSNNQGVFLLGGKKLTLATYRFMELYPTNANVIAMREKGYTVLMRSSSMPVPVRDWIMRQHNRKHGGCKITYTEMLNAVTTAESSWAAYDDKKVTSRGCATKGECIYAKLYAKHVKDNFFEYIPTWDAFKRLQAGECIQM